uniref:Podocalyxin like 2 n=1 Tax=Latimeria chalumnae TaxID=7897 RepID=H3ASX8_LATCH
ASPEEALEGTWSMTPSTEMAQLRLVDQDDPEPVGLDQLPTVSPSSQESGFSSEENEEIQTLQKQYFWDNGAEENRTALDTGPSALPADYSFLGPLPKLIFGSTDRLEMTPMQQLDPDTVELTQSNFSSTETKEDLTDPTELAPSLKVVGSLASPVGPPESEEALGSPDAGDVNPVTRTAVATDEGDHKRILTPNLVTEEMVISVTPGLLLLSAAPVTTLTGTNKVVESVSMVTTAEHGRIDTAIVVTTPQTEITGTAERIPDLSDGRGITPPWSRPGAAGTEPDFRSQTPNQDINKEPTSAEMDQKFTTYTENPEDPQDSTQVICIDWNNLSVKSYIILNVSHNMDCKKKRLQNGARFLSLVGRAFSRRTERPQESWRILLSKPNEDDSRLLMTLTGEQGVIPVKDLLAAMRDINRDLQEVGIQNFTAAAACQSKVNPSRSDYGKLFVVLVIIGSICVIIIVVGLVYICWQRRLPKLKAMSHGEELHFVENGCHDNPTLDVTIDSQSEMQEKQQSVNGGALDGPDSWSVLVNRRAVDEAETLEEDTHL